ncbi:putative tRNA pseudouridine synthase Pus10 [Phthorimaea operculella]|nr:putative tRNA pseudouridine synthase Pus10 [Phthorimaea operculella]
MDQKAVIKICKELGCCNACCARYIGVKNPNAYGNPKEFIDKYLETSAPDKTAEKATDNVVTVEPSEEVKKDTQVQEDDKNNGSASPPAKRKKNLEDKDANTTEKSTEDQKNNLQPHSNQTETNGTTAEQNSNDHYKPSAKRKKMDICLSCLGILQESTWQQSLEAVKEQLDKKGYDCSEFACALSAPIATIVRELAIGLHLKHHFPEYEISTVTPLKEAWKWSFGVKLESHINKTLTSGSTCPLLITVAMEYPDDATELEIVKDLSPALFAERRQQRKRFTVELTRRSVEQALDGVTFEKLQQMGWIPAPRVNVAAHCASVACAHAPHYLGGRYIKLSRELPQTPWLVSGKRMMESSVQETIFDPLAKLYQMAADEVECRMKFMSAGREDVDVRCLGEGRPFAIEVADPRRQLTADELKKACEQISAGGKVVVKELVYVTKDDLTLLKKGEETKTKTYEALCIKLSHTKEEKDAKTEGPAVVTERDITNINAFRNTDAADAKIALQQKTPIRIKFQLGFNIMNWVSDQPQLFWVRLVTEAGTYVKEWAHGELGRTSPSLSTALGARTDILALDVAAVDLPWPHTNIK